MLIFLLRFPVWSSGIFFSRIGIKDLDTSNFIGIARFHPKLALGLAYDLHKKSDCLEKN